MWMVNGSVGESAVGNTPCLNSSCITVYGIAMAGNECESKCGIGTNNEKVMDLDTSAYESLNGITVYKI